MDQSLQEDYNEEAGACQANLETVLINLRFHQSTHIDSVYAMGLAVSFQPMLIMQLLNNPPDTHLSA